MATLILSAVGSAFGGPIGSTIGAIVGQQIDQRLFAPKARHGPRLGDLSVQTSSYGTAIPKLFGTMRVAGSVIWSTDLVEHRNRSGGGKGRPKVVTYSYSASFAVALSARPVRSVRRIWADGKLLRGAAGDLKSAGTFRLLTGSEDQAPDPLVAAAEGAEATAFRGIACAVFEDLALEDFGNRIPSLTFEVEADPGAVSIGAIAVELSGGVVAAGETPVLAGYAAGGDSVRGAIEGLADVVPLSIADSGDVLRIEARPTVEATIGSDEECGRRRIVRRPAASVAAETAIAYHEVERDYQTGLQRAVRGGGPGRGADRRALPAVLDAAAAKALAEFRLAALWAARSEARVELGWRRAGLRAGTALRLQDEAGIWLVRRSTLGPMKLTLELVRVTGDPVPNAVAAAPGRPVSELDQPLGRTILRLLDLPLGEPAGPRPLLFAAAAGEGAGWRRAPLLASWDGGASWEEAGATEPATAIGTALDALPPAGSALFDARSALEVELVNEAMTLESRSDAALAAGANLALVGSELVQFGVAEPLGGRRFRLSRLLRGRRGTEWAAALHAPGEDFVRIEPDRLLAIEAPAGAAGGEARLIAAGPADPIEGVEAAAAVTGESLRPPAPVHLRAETQPNGDVSLRWVRRSRLGWTWTSGADTPLGEEQERYRVALAGPTFARVVETVEPALLYTAAEQAADGTVGERTASVVQLGTHAASRPATIDLP